MMNDLTSLIDFLLTTGLLAIPIALLLWLARGSDSPSGSPFGMRFDASPPPVPEEVDPPRWRIELIGQGKVTSGRSTQVRVENCIQRQSADGTAIVRECPRRLKHPTLPGSR
jgi:hypothetical protein